MIDDEEGIHLEAIGDFAPATEIVVSVFFCFAAVAAAVDDERFGVDDLHFGGWWSGFVGGR